MPLFAKNKPSQRVEFEGGFVELQFLSKGVKDEIKKRSTESLKGFDTKIIKQMQRGEIKNEDELPVDALNLVGPMLDIEYYKLSHAIRSWSDGDTPITEETVKEMDEEVFDLISKKVDEMNELKPGERKN